LATKTSARAKSKAIPKAIVNFCQVLNQKLKAKFGKRGEGVIAEFLFDRWLLKALCDDGNKTGLVTEALLHNKSHLWRNL